MNREGQIMEQRRYILSTCGTSLLTNDSGDLRSLLNRYANYHSAKDIPEEDRKRIEQHLAVRHAAVQSASLDEMRKLSAEINSLLRLYPEGLHGKGDMHTLLCTDTWLGESAASIVKAWLTQHGLNATVYRLRDLQTKDLQAFQLAMSELTRWCADILPGYQASGYRVIFNLTGGFKSIQGFLQTLGMFYADESVYIFESEKEVLHLPRLPVRMDADATLREHLLSFRRMANDLTATTESCKNIPQTMVMEIDGQMTLSPWGELAWQESYRDIYGEQLLDPISEKLVLGPGFRDSIKALSKDRLVLVNQRLDQLARRLETGYNPRSLDFKPLSSNAMAPSTHECNAWSDQDAPRLFGHFEDARFVVDRLGKGLH
jgi:putative CRISPR-associated protein (TIGR02619 family)